MLSPSRLVVCTTTHTVSVSRRPCCRIGPEDGGLTNAKALLPPCWRATRRQWEAYVAAMREAGAHVFIADEQPGFPDAHYVEDPFVIIGRLLFVCRPPRPTRAPEGQTLLPVVLEAAKHRVLPSGAAAPAQPLPVCGTCSVCQTSDDGSLVTREAPADATIEGGDVLVCFDRVLVGISDRTNTAGASALRDALHAVVCEKMRVDFVPLQNSVDPDGGVLHLKTGMTEIVPGVLLRCPQLVTPYSFDWATVIVSPRAEGYLTNVVRYRNTIIAAHCSDENPSSVRCPADAAECNADCLRDSAPLDRSTESTFVRTLRHVAESNGYTFLPLNMSQFRIMDGSLTCLSLRF